MEGVMNRDLLKKIQSITRKEGGDVPFVSIYNREVEGFSDEEISDHVKYLKDEGVVEAISDKTLDGEKWYPVKILRNLDD